MYHTCSQNTLSVTKSFLICQGKALVTSAFKLSILIFLTEISVRLSYNGFFGNAARKRYAIHKRPIHCTVKSRGTFFCHQLQTALDKKCIFKAWFVDIQQSD